MTEARTQAPSPDDILVAATEVARDWAAERHERQRRRALDPADFARLAEIGFLHLGAPAEHGGAFESAEASTGAIARILRMLAAGDASVALVASMHPAVAYVGGWLAEAQAPTEHAAAWDAQRRFLAETSLAGHWWGTITSEPGSGGDPMNTRASAVPDGNGGYRMSGRKHFGSGSGVTSFMLTTAVPDGEAAPDWFVLDVRDLPWDGSRGVTLLSEWDGHGMTATQSHAIAFEGVPVVRSAWPGAFEREAPVNPGFVTTLFSAVIVGVVDAAIDEARRKLAPREDDLGAFERVEWLRALREAWLVDQAFAGLVRATEREGGRNAILAKSAIAELAESVTTRLCRVMGGGTFARHSPFGFWAQDVKALGFLRPPWGMAHRMAYQEAFEATA